MTGVLWDVLLVCFSSSIWSWFTPTLCIAFADSLAAEDLVLPERIHAMHLARTLGLDLPRIAELFGMTDEEVDRHLGYLEYLRPPDP